MLLRSQRSQLCGLRQRFFVPLGRVDDTNLGYEQPAEPPYCGLHEIPPGNPKLQHTRRARINLNPLSQSATPLGPPRQASRDNFGGGGGHATGRRRRTTPYVSRRLAAGNYRRKIFDTVLSRAEFVNYGACSMYFTKHVAPC
eukprot:1185386-Prorocentrum_minimum.AAC.2